MKSIVAVICSFLLVFSSLANDYHLLENSRLDKLVKKYEYMIAVHPQADNLDFRAKIEEQFKKEVIAVTKTLGEGELRANIRNIISKIPVKEKREMFLDILNNETKEDLGKLIIAQDLLSSAFRGESSNFTGHPRFGEIVVYGLLASFILYAILDAVFERINYEKFKSDSPHVDWGGTDTYYCSSRAASFLQKDKLKRVAKTKCLNQASYPETCRFDEWDVNEIVDYDYWGDVVSTSCYIQAVYKADR